MKNTFGHLWFEEVWNKDRREAIAELMPAAAVIHDGAQAYHGPEEFATAFFDRIRSAFSEMRVTVEDVIVDGEKECYRWSCTGRHTGNGLGIPATGKICTVTGMTMLRMANGKFAEAWQNVDMLGLMQQITSAGSSTSGPERAASSPASA